MQGLELSRDFHHRCCLPLLESRLPDILPFLAAGLVGEGSECFGFDDAISRDHDWGPAVCLWLPERVLHARLPEVEAALARLPDSFEGWPTRMTPDRRMGRTGPMSIEGFYARFIQLPRAPGNWQEWWRIPEHHLATCTNGAVFHDPYGRFSSIRAALLAFYPEDVRLKKMAARCAAMAQCGQYNLPRALRRNDPVAAMLAAARFIEQTLAMLFLLNRRYAPFHKWAWRAAARLPLLGNETSALLERLSGLNWKLGARVMDLAMATVEDACTAVAGELHRQGIDDAPGNWLLAHAQSIQNRIAEPGIRAMHLMLG